MTFLCLSVSPFFAFLAIFIACMGLFALATFTAERRTKEIGILRTMGMTEKGIMHVFIIQGVWIGVIGTAAGAALGISVSWALDRFELIKIPGDVYFVDHLPATMDPVTILMIVVASILVSFGATIHPARQASRLQPVDAIRHE